MYSLPASDKNFSLSFKAQKFIEGATHSPVERHGRWLQAFSKEDLSGLLTKEIYQRVAGVNPYVRNADQSNQGVLNSYLHSYLMDDVLAKVDRASMRYGLEVRAPFLAREVVEFLTTLPYQYKLSGFTTKYLLKDKLPKNIVRRKKKGFGVPVSEWLKGDLKPPLLELLSKKKLLRQGIFSPDYVQKIIGEHMSGRKNNDKKLWALLVFQLWHEQFNA